MLEKDSEERQQLQEDQRALEYLEYEHAAPEHEEEQGSMHRQQQKLERELGGRN